MPTMPAAVATMAQGGADRPDRRRLLAAAAAQLTAAGVEDAERDALWLLAAACGLDSPAGMPRSGSLDPDAARRFAGWLARRAAREPVSRILGRRGFWTLDLAVTPDVLDPRADTELLVDLVLAGRPEREAPVTIVDLGTGSGCLLLALLSEFPAAHGVGVDLSAAALAVAHRNAAITGLAGRADFLRGDWCTALADGCADIVVSNPPYIASAALPGLMPEVRAHDPVLALDGGVQGLDAYRRIVPELPRLLRPDGLSVLEVDGSTAGPVAGLLAAAGARRARPARDLAGQMRALVAQW